GGGAQRADGGPPPWPARFNTRTSLGGGKKKTKKKKKKGSTKEGGDEKKNPPIAMIWLMMNAAMKPPIMLPSPPNTQIMKISGPNVLPMKGCTSYCSAKRQAPRPASAPPIADVPRYVRR